MIGNIIYGILQLNSKTVYGVTKNGQIRELVSIYPKMEYKILVSTKKNYQLVNVMCCCKIVSFDKNIYHGTIQECYGELGILNNELNFIRKISSYGWAKIDYKDYAENDLIKTKDGKRTKK